MYKKPVAREVGAGALYPTEKFSPSYKIKTYHCRYVFKYISPPKYVTSVEAISHPLSLHCLAIRGCFVRTKDMLPDRHQQNCFPGFLLVLTVLMLPCRDRYGTKRLNVTVTRQVITHF